MLSKLMDPMTVIVAGLTYTRRGLFVNSSCLVFTFNILLFLCSDPMRTIFSPSSNNASLQTHPPINNMLCCVVLCCVVLCCGIAYHLPTSGPVKYCISFSVKGMISTEHNTIQQHSTTTTQHNTTHTWGRSCYSAGLG